MQGSIKIIVLSYLAFIFLNAQPLTASHLAAVNADQASRGGCQSPSNLHVSGVTAVNTRLNWNAVQSADHYVIRGNKLNRPGSVSLVVSGSLTVKLVSGLEAGTDYWWQIRACCDVAESNCSPWSTADTFSTSCETPENLDTVNVTLNAARLVWGAASGTAAYEVRGRKMGQNFISVQTNRSYLNTGAILEEDTIYEWRVRSLCSGVDSRRSTFSNFQIFRTLAASCSDGIQNQDETGIDCGGLLCDPCPTCNDGIQNGDETGIDCGGSCDPCNFECGELLNDLRDGKSYNTIQIGGQCWMAENLNIGTIITAASLQSDNGAFEKYCYNNQENQCDLYGGLYQWSEAANYAAGSSASPSRVQGVCPEGWHLPSDAEWQSLEALLGMESTEIVLTGYRGSDQGDQLKTTGTAYWSTGNSGTNSSGFSARGGGLRTSFGTFSTFGNNTYFWTSAEYGSGQSWFRALQYDLGSVRREFGLKEFGLAVRCVLDREPTCDDGIQNADETAVDCGGSSCQSCPDRCSDGIQNGDETGIDCGGASCISCNDPGRCADGLQNSDETGIDCGGADCQSCNDRCSDGFQNGDETGIDCGGTSCQSCLSRCSDGIQNGDETGVDCGGSSCQSCPDRCSDGMQNGDETGVDCGGNRCQSCMSRCSDGFQNGDETNIDCGGTDCIDCNAANRCNDGIQNADETGVDCGGADCQSCPARCSDGNQNGDETGIDCGGADCVSCTDRCSDGLLNGDETGIDCGGTNCPACPTCSDDIQNQDETGVDCGGFSCQSCASRCSDDIQNGDETGVDCGGNSCQTCLTRCNDGIQNGDETDIDCGGISCNPCFTCGDLLTDSRDGHTYQTVQIGNQCWMADNLNYGVRISSVNTGSTHADQTDNNVAEKYCYGNSTLNCDQYGGLYEWDELMNYEQSSSSVPSAVQGLCPPGWHVPSDGEWSELENYLIAGGYNYDGSFSGNKIAKSLASTNGWVNTNSVGAIGNNQSLNNSSGMTMPAGGYRNTKGYFGHIFTFGGKFGYFWSATETVQSAAISRIIAYRNSDISDEIRNKMNGYSCRCVKD